MSTSDFISLVMLEILMYFPPGQDSSFLGSFTDQNAEVGVVDPFYISVKGKKNASDQLRFGN